MYAFFLAINPNREEEMGVKGLKDVFLNKILLLNLNHNYSDFDYRHLTMGLSLR